VRNGDKNFSFEIGSLNVFVEIGNQEGNHGNTSSERDVQSTEDN